MKNLPTGNQSGGLSRRVIATALGAVIAFGPMMASAQSMGPRQSGDTNASAGAGNISSAAVDPVALERAHKKLREAVAIADHFLPEAQAQGLSDSWRMTMITNLMKGTQENFANVASAKTLTEARMAAIEVAAAGIMSSTAERSKVLGSVTGDLVFSPMTPCRLVDTTQSGGGGPFVNGEARTYFYSSNYGSSGCSPDLVAGFGSTRPAAMAVNINVLALSQGFAGIGYLAAYPTGGSPNTAWMTYQQGNALANAGVMPINQATGNYNIFVQFGTHIKIDVFGVFSSPAATALDCTGAAGSTISIPANSNNYYYPATACPTGYRAVTPYCYTLNAAGVYLNGSGLDGAFGTQTFCSYINLNAAPVSVYVGQSCCRVPGR